jgi:hypothetical protein
MIRRPLLATFSVGFSVSVAAFAVTGCSSSGGATPADSGAASSASTTAEAGTTLKLQWLVRPLTLSLGIADAGSEYIWDGGDAGGLRSSPYAKGPDGGAIGLEGVNVCVHDDPTIPCVTSASDGTFTLTGLPVRSNVEVTLEKAGYASVLIPIATASTDMDGRSNPIPMMDGDGGAPPIGTSVDWANTGQVQVFVLGQDPTSGVYRGEPGASLSLAPQGGQGPFYLDDGRHIVEGATTFVDAYAWYFNLAAGTYTLTFDDSHSDCESIAFPFGGWGYPGPMGSHSLTFPIVPGYVLPLIGEICTPLGNVVSTEAGGGGASSDGEASAGDSGGLDGASE